MESKDNLSGFSKDIKGHVGSFLSHADKSAFAQTSSANNSNRLSA